MDRFLELADAAVVQTPRCRLAESNLAAAIEHRRITTFFGIPGTGKSVAAAAATSALVPNSSLHITLTTRPNPAQLANFLVKDATGVNPEETRWRGAYTLELELARLADRGRRCHLTIDEAQNLSAECIEWLRWLHFETERPFSLLLVGGPQLADRLSASPQLVRRVFRATRFRPMPTAEVVPTLRAYHKIYAEADEHLLAEIDSQRFEGNFGKWLNFSIDAYDECLQDGVPTLTREIANRVLERIDASLA